MKKRRCLCQILIFVRWKWNRSTELSPFEVDSYFLLARYGMAYGAFRRLGQVNVAHCDFRLVGAMMVSLEKR